MACLLTTMSLRLKPSEIFVTIMRIQAALQHIKKKKYIQLSRLRGKIRISPLSACLENTSDEGTNFFKALPKRRSYLPKKPRKVSYLYFRGSSSAFEKTTCTN